MTRTAWGFRGREYLLKTQFPSVSVRLRQIIKSYLKLEEWHKIKQSLTQWRYAFTNGSLHCVAGDHRNRGQWTKKPNNCVSPWIPAQDWYQNCGPRSGALSLPIIQIFFIYKPWILESTPGIKRVRRSNSIFDFQLKIIAKCLSFPRMYCLQILILDKTENQNKN